MLGEYMHIEYYVNNALPRTVHTIMLCAYHQAIYVYCT